MLKTQLLIGFVMIVMAQAIDPIRLEHEWASFKVSFFQLKMLIFKSYLIRFFHNFFPNTMINREIITEHIDLAKKNNSVNKSLLINWISLNNIINCIIRKNLHFF